MEDKSKSVKGTKKILSFNYNKDDNPENPGDFWHPKYSSLVRSDFDSNIVEKWSEVRCSNAPRRRCLHMSFIFKNYLYVYGGMDINEGKMTDLHRINLNNFDSPKWEEIRTLGILPERLSGQSGVLVNNLFYMLGGENECEKSTNSLYILDLESFKWEKRIFLESDVPNLYGHTLNYYEKENTLYTYGGFSKGSYINSIFSYSIDKYEWTEYKYADISNNDEAPVGRIFHSSLINKDYLYIYAGLNEVSTLDDMWKFSLIDKKWEKIIYNNTEENIPHAKSGHSAVYYEPWDSIIIFGGKYTNIQERNEMWKFDLKTNSFSILHDSLLERYADFENTQAAFMKRSYSNKKFRPNLTNENASTLKESRRYSLLKASKINFGINSGTSSNNQKPKAKFEDLLLGTPISKKMKNSLIYKMEMPDNSNQKYAPVSLGTQSNFDKEVIKNGVVPIPRDGHSAVIQNNSMIIFGGDRNKFPFNDLFIFNI